MNKKQNPTDGFLISAYKAGDTSALAILVKRYHKVFCEKAYWVTKDKDIAKDIAQETWIIIIKKMDQIENLESFKSWALRIVYTRAIDALKQKNKENKNVASVGNIGFDARPDANNGWFDRSVGCC